MNMFFNSLYAGYKFQQTTFWNIFLFFLEIGIWHFMQVVSLEDNLHEVSDPNFWV